MKNKWILLAAFFVSFFSKLSGKHVIDHTLQMYRRISPHCLCILPGFSDSGDTQTSMNIHVPFGHAVFIENHLGTSSVLSDQDSIYMCSLVGVFCSRHFSIIPLFHTGHESPESPRIDFFLFGGIREDFKILFSPIVMSYESFPIQIRCRYEYSGKSAQFGWNRARIHYD